MVTKKWPPPASGPRRKLPKAEMGPLPKPAPMYPWGPLSLRDDQVYTSALSLLAFQVDAPTVRIADALDVVQAQPEPFHFMNVAGRYPVKFIEHLVEMIFGNADPFIGNGDPDLSIASPGSKCKPGDIFTILKAIVQQVV